MFFDQDKGFGLINPDGAGKDVFFQVSSLKDGDEIIQGATVSITKNVGHLFRRLLSNAGLATLAPVHY